MSRLRRFLVLCVILGLAGTAGGAGTFASFNASTTNGGATFATGTIVLSNQKDTNTACLSTGADNLIGTGDDTDNATSCDVLFSLSLKKPGDTATVDLTLSNVGTLGATALKGYRSVACTNSSVGTYSGSGDLCGNVQLEIQQYTSAANRTADDATGGTCWYGGGTATDCATDATKTLATFSTAYPDVTTSLNLGASAASDVRYLRVTLTIPSAAGNTLQGRQAAFGFGWTLEQ